MTPLRHPLARSLTAPARSLPVCARSLTAPARSLTASTRSLAAFALSLAMSACSPAPVAPPPPVAAVASVAPVASAAPASVASSASASAASVAPAAAAAPPSGDAAPVSMEVPDSAATPLLAPGFQALAVPGFTPAVVAVPVGSTGVRPVVVATHGNYDRPEWQCQVWQPIVKARGFVLCPRGRRRADSPGPQDDRFEYASNQALEREIDAGLAALREAFPGRVADGPVVYAGFSLGAIMGVELATRHPERFDRLVLIEGGDRWTLAAARAFGKGGGHRVLFACSQGGCAASARVAVGTLSRAAVTVDAVKGKSQGHTYVGDVMDRYAERFAWLTEDDPRWQ